MKIFLKIILISILFVVVSTSLIIEFSDDGGTFLICLLFGGLITLFVIIKLKINFHFEKLFLLFGVLIVPTYFSFYSLNISQTDWAYNKITKVPIENLEQFAKTKNIELIPKNCRYAWIGCRYKKIDFVKNRKGDKMNAVGWRGKTVFAYYDINEKDFSGSYH